MYFGKREPSRAVFVQNARAADDAKAGVVNRVGAIERERGIVGDVAGAKSSGYSPVADLQDATVNGRAAAVSVRAAQCEISTAVLLNETRSGDNPGIGRVRAERTYGKILARCSADGAGTGQRAEVEQAAGICVHVSAVEVVSRRGADGCGRTQSKRATALQSDGPDVTRII